MLNICPIFRAAPRILQRVSTIRCALASERLLPAGRLGARNVEPNSPGQARLPRLHSNTRAGSGGGGGVQGRREGHLVAPLPFQALVRHIWLSETARQHSPSLPPQGPGAELPLPVALWSPLREFLTASTKAPKPKPTARPGRKGAERAGQGAQVLRGAAKPRLPRTEPRCRRWREGPPKQSTRGAGRFGSASLSGPLEPPPAAGPPQGPPRQ